MLYCRTSNNQPPEETPTTSEVTESSSEFVEESTEDLPCSYQIDYLSVVDQVKDDEFFKVCFIIKSKSID